MKQYDFRKTFIFISNIIILVAEIASWGLIWNHYYSQNIMYPFEKNGNLAILALYGVVVFIFTRIYNGYKINRNNITSLIISGLISVTFANVITYIQSCLVSHHILNPKPFIILSIIDTIIITIWSNISNRIYYKIFPPYEILFIYEKDNSARELVYKMIERSQKYRIVKSISTREFPQEYIKENMLNYKTVVLCDISSAKRNKLIKLCFDNSIRVYITPKLSDILIRASEEINLIDTPLLVNSGKKLSLFQRFIKRSMDITIALIGIIITAPIMLITAIAIKAYDKGPVFFIQERVTLDKKIFKIIKFRSMIEEAEKEGIPIPATDNDNRITPIGKIIRTTRIDELPQFFNILKGEMSLVGPRPERIEHVAKYTKEIPEFTYRYKVKAGLTGYAQLLGKYNTTPYDKLKMDLIYITNYSILNDLKYILMTIKILFIRESTDGFKNND